MIDLSRLIHIRLPGGFFVAAIELTEEPLLDALGREAVAQTIINGNRLRMTIRRGLDERELSITLYHEILEAATVGASSPPESVMLLNEGDFERIAHEMHDRYGEASAANLNRMLQSFGFVGE